MKKSRKLQLQDSLLLYFTGFTRFSSEIQEIAAPQNKTAQLLEMKELVDRAVSVLIDEDVDLDEFGALLDRAWFLKRGSSSIVTTDAIDSIYRRALNAGAVGGKLLGAGGGGFLLFYVPEDAKESVKRNLSDLMRVPFEFESGGTQVVHYAPETYDASGMWV